MPTIQQVARTQPYSHLMQTCRLYYQLLSTYEMFTYTETKIIPDIQASVQHLEFRRPSQFRTTMQYNIFASPKKNSIHCTRPLRLALAEFGSEQGRAEPGNVETHCYNRLKYESLNPLKIAPKKKIYPTVPDFRKSVAF